MPQHHRNNSQSQIQQTTQHQPTIGTSMVVTQSNSHTHANQPTHTVSSAGGGVPVSNPADKALIKKLQGHIKDLETNLVLNKDILCKILASNGIEEVNNQLMTVIREL